MVCSTRYAGRTSGHMGILADIAGTKDGVQPDFNDLLGDRLAASIITNGGF